MRVTTHVADVHIAVHLAVQMVEAMDGHTMSIRPEHVTNGNQAATLALLWATAIQFEVGAYVWTLESWQDSIFLCSCPTSQTFQGIWPTQAGLVHSATALLGNRFDAVEETSVNQGCCAYAAGSAAGAGGQPEDGGGARGGPQLAPHAAPGAAAAHRRGDAVRRRGACRGATRLGPGAFLCMWFGELGRRNRQEGHFRLALRPALAAAATHDMLYSIM